MRSIIDRWLAPALALTILSLQSAPLVADTLIPLTLHQDLDTFYVSVSVSGSGAEDYLVDTGAGYMTITATTLLLLQEAGTATQIGELDGQLANGVTLRVPLYRLDEIRIGRSCLLRNVEAAVLPGASRGLFGLSALRKTSPFELSFNPPTLRVNNCL